MLSCPDKLHLPGDPAPVQSEANDVTAPRRRFSSGGDTSDINRNKETVDIHDIHDIHETHSRPPSAMSYKDGKSHFQAFLFVCLTRSFMRNISIIPVKEFI